MCVCELEWIVGEQWSETKRSKAKKGFFVLFFFYLFAFALVWQLVKYWNSYTKNTTTWHLCWMLIAHADTAYISISTRLHTSRIPLMGCLKKKRKNISNMQLSWECCLVVVHANDTGDVSGTEFVCLGCFFFLSRFIHSFEISFTLANFSMKSILRRCAFEFSIETTTT